jgi:hypothetical protein
MAVITCIPADTARVAQQTGAAAWTQDLRWYALMGACLNTTY